MMVCDQLVKIRTLLNVAEEGPPKGPSTGTPLKEEVPEEQR